MLKLTYMDTGLISYLEFQYYFGFGPVIQPHLTQIFIFFIKYSEFEPAGMLLKIKNSKIMIKLWIMRDLPLPACLTNH